MLSASSFGELLLSGGEEVEEDLVCCWTSGSGILRGNEEGPFAGEDGYLLAMLVLSALLLVLLLSAAFLRAIAVMIDRCEGDIDIDDDDDDDDGREMEEEKDEAKKWARRAQCRVGNDSAVAKSIKVVEIGRMLSCRHSTDISSSILSCRSSIYLDLPLPPFALQTTHHQIITHKMLYR